MRVDGAPTPNSFNLGSGLNDNSKLSATSTAKVIDDDDLAVLAVYDIPYSRETGVQEIK